MEEKTQLPVEVADEIEIKAQEYARTYSGTKLIKRPYIAGATAYAKKLHQVETHNGLLKTEIKHLNTVIEKLQAQAGAVWVKASERLPDKDGLICFKVCGGYMNAYVITRSGGVRRIESSGQCVIKNWKDGEWLDESGTAAPLTQERADLIREANSRDLDGMVKATDTVTISMVNMNEVDKLKRLAIDRQTKGDQLMSALRSLRLSVTAHPDYTGEENAEWTDLVETADEAILDWLERDEDKEQWRRFMPEEEQVQPKEQVVIHNNSDAFRNWVSDIKGYPFTLLGHSTGVWLPAGVTLQQFETDWEAYEKANNPDKKEVNNG